MPTPLSKRPAPHRARAKPQHSVGPFAFQIHDWRRYALALPAIASRANDSNGGTVHSMAGRSSYSSRGSQNSHTDLGSTALVDILRLPDHFEPWLSWLRPTIRRPPGRSLLFSS